MRKEARYRIDIACQVTAGERAVYLELSRDISDIFLARHRQMEVLVQLTGVILSLSAILIWLLSYFLTRPIRKLSIGTREIARGTMLSGCLSGDTMRCQSWPRILIRMAQTVEEKILSLDRRAAHRQEEFTANFAHELKTPLTSIIGYADMLRSSPLSQEEQLVCANYIFGEESAWKRCPLSCWTYLFCAAATFQKDVLRQSGCCSQSATSIAPQAIKRALCSASPLKKPRCMWSRI
ncbi:MAG: sensor histidine kinase [Clostridia bacterium]